MTANTANLHSMSWSLRARLGELQAVCNASASNKKNLAMHSMALAAARKAHRCYQKSTDKRDTVKPLLLDFGCGTGRFVRFFGNRGYQVIGLEITREMLEESRKFGMPQDALLAHFDGRSIPLPDKSVDIVWIAGVLKYTLFPPGAQCRHGNNLEESGSFKPTYPQIVREFFRVLKPGGIIANLETFVDQPVNVFTKAFEDAGFASEGISIARQYGGLLERGFEWRDCHGLPRRLISLIAGAIAEFRLHFADPRRPPLAAFRDYLFIWRKPGTAIHVFNRSPGLSRELNEHEYRAAAFTWTPQPL